MLQYYYCNYNMEKVPDRFNLAATKEASVNISNAAEYPRVTHRVPYDPSELVISTSEGPSQRYPWCIKPVPAWAGWTIRCFGKAVFYALKH